MFQTQNSDNLHTFHIVTREYESDLVRDDWYASTVSFQHGALSILWKECDGVYIGHLYDKYLVYITYILSHI